METIARIRYPGDWLMSLNGDQFDTAARALQSVLPDRRSASLRRNVSQVYFQTDEHISSFSQLSAGYQTIISMCADIIRLLFARWSTITSATAIVLVDELDAHLHPSWSMRIVRALREAFPQVQFVASTHDPLVLRGLRNGEVALVRRPEKATVIVDQNLPPLEGMQVDQILTSRVFGLNSTIDPDTEALFDEFYHLKSLPSEPARNARIAEIRGRVGDREALGRNETERLMLQAAKEFVNRSLASEDVRSELSEDTLGRLRLIAARGASERRRRAE